MEYLRVSDFETDLRDALTRVGKTILNPAALTPEEQLYLEESAADGARIGFKVAAGLLDPDLGARLIRRNLARQRDMVSRAGQRAIARNWGVFHWIVEFAVGAAASGAATGIIRRVKEWSE